MFLYLIAVAQAKDTKGGSTDELQSNNNDHLVLKFITLSNVLFSSTIMCILLSTRL